MQTEKFFSQQKHHKKLMLVFLLITFFLVVLSLFIGQYGLTFKQIFQYLFGIGDSAKSAMIRNILVNIRLPRTIASVLIGGILAVSGVTYQCVFRNTLVSQDILGVSTSACVGAALGIVLGWTAVQIQLLSFSLGMINIACIFILSSQFKFDKTLSLVLSGILIGGAMSSTLALIKYLANPETHLQAIIFWTMGDIASIDYNQLTLIAGPVFICTTLIYLHRWKLNCFCFSDADAQSLGFDVKKYRVMFLVCATVLVASAVSISGSIGWVGLVIPQLVRLVIGTDNRYTLPLSFLMGSSFLITVDIINRLISSAELPVGIISGLLGLPLFIICWFANAKKSQERLV